MCFFLRLNSRQNLSGWPKAEIWLPFSPVANSHQHRQCGPKIPCRPENAKFGQNPCAQNGHGFWPFLPKIWDPELRHNFHHFLVPSDNSGRYTAPPKISAHSGAVCISYEFFCVPVSPFWTIFKTVFQRPKNCSLSPPSRVLRPRKKSRPSKHVGRLSAAHGGFSHEGG